MASMSPFSIEFLLHGNRAENNNPGGHPPEQVLKTKERNYEFHEPSSKSSNLPPGSLPSFVFGNSTEAPKRTRMPRTRFFSYQIKGLENSFRRSPYILPKAREELAIQLGLSKFNVQTWYKNRRYKWRRENGMRRVLPGVQADTREAYAFLTRRTCWPVQVHPDPVDGFSCNCPVSYKYERIPCCSAPASHISEEASFPLSKSGE